ncbi:MAG: EAL domain-containing protein [Sideroxydans sp.]|nr:EAL domain-containing protein [Sideroxydans sp.]
MIMLKSGDMQHQQRLHILYEMALVIGSEVSLKPLLTHTLQHLLEYTSFSAGFVCLDVPAAGAASGGMLEVSVDAAVGDSDLTEFVGRKIMLPAALLYGAAELAANKYTLSCCAERYEVFLRLPLGKCGVVVLLAPQMPDGEPPALEKFQPVMENLDKAIKRCGQNDDYTRELIAEHEQMAKLLEQSQFSLRTLIDQSPIGVSFSRDGVVLDANAAYLQIFGYDDIAELRDQLVYHHIAPQCRPALEERIWLRMLGEEVENVYELTGLHRNGTHIPLLVSVRRVHLPDGAVTFSFVIDITERKRSENALKNSNELLQSVLETAPIRVFWKDEHGRYLGCNTAFARDAGFNSAASVIGKDDSELGWKVQAESHRAIDREVMESGKPKLAYEEMQTRADGQHAWLRASKVPMRNGEGKVIGVLGIYDDITMQKQSDKQIRQLAFYDPLTRLPNRRLLADRLQQVLATSLRSGQYGALMLLDLDHFKTINDTQGHSVGDKMLVETALRLRDCVRVGDSVARLGGDEFVVVLEGLGNGLSHASVKAEMIADKIRDELSEPYWINGGEHHITPSIGITMFRGNQDSQEDLFIRADTAMYQAKAKGRNTICFFDPIMQSALEMRSEMEKKLRGAMLRQELELYYQGQMDNSGQPVGAEVLLRWKHPVSGMVSPAQFIPIAEDSGLIQPIGQWVLEQACAQLAIWQNDPLFSHLSVAVNVSARQFRQSSFVELVRSTLTSSGINPSRLKLELTESLVLDNVADTINKMAHLKALGVRFSMDDFGTGYSSLTYLKQLPLDQIKIDQSFVRDITTDQSDATIVQTIIAMSQSLGLDVIAEGVETEEQLDFLKLHNCRAFQGYLFGKPMPVAEFEQQMAVLSVPQPRDGLRAVAVDE